MINTTSMGIRYGSSPLISTSSTFTLVNLSHIRLISFRTVLLHGKINYDHIPRIFLRHYQLLGFVFTFSNVLLCSYSHARCAMLTTTDLLQIWVAVHDDPSIAAPSTSSGTLIPESFNNIHLRRAL